MAVAGIKVERTSRGVPKFVTIDLRKHSDFIPLLEEKGVELAEPVQWTAKMKKSFAQAKIPKKSISIEVCLKLMIKN